MRIAINALSARTGGGVVYLKNIIRELAGDGAIDEIVVFVRSDMADQLAPHTMSSVTRVEVCIHNLLHRFCYEQVVLPIKLARRRVDVLFAPAEVASVFAPCPIVLGLQNAIIGSKSAIHGSVPARLRNIGLYLLAWISVRRAGELIFVSETARRNTSHALGIDSRRGHVIYHGVDPLFLDCAASTEIRTEDARGLVLHVGAVAPHKNLECLIDAYAMLGSEVRARHPLKFVGPVIDAQYGVKIADMLRSAGFETERVLSGDVPFHELPSVYVSASV